MQQEINKIISKLSILKESPAKSIKGGGDISPSDIPTEAPIKTSKLPQEEIKNTTLAQQSKTVVSVNIENLPIYFLGSAKERLRLQEGITKSGKPLIIFDTTQNGKGYKLSISPAAAYGLLTGFDQDIFTVIQCKLYEGAKKDGICPQKLTLWLSEFPKIMKIQKTGKLYGHIRESVRRLSEITIYHENFVKNRKESQGTLEPLEDTQFKLIHYNKTRYESLMKENENVVQRQYLEIGIPEWIQNDINSNYTTAFDPNTYFSLPGDRTRRLYRFLELIRYVKLRKVYYSKILSELSMTNVTTNLNRNLKRYIEPLVSIGYLEAYQINDDHICFTFKDIKPSFESFPSLKQNTLDFQQEDLVETMLEYLKDEKSRNWYNQIARKVPENIIYLCLSLTKETEKFDTIKTNKGAVFTDHIKRECAERGICCS